MTVTGEGDAVEPVARTGAVGQWCGQCGMAVAPGHGESVAGVEGAEVADHSRCEGRAVLEPPRWCVHCRRRMVVQVTPGGWTATCSRHGSSEHSTWR